MNQAEFAEQVAAGFGDAQSVAEVTATPGGGSWLPNLGQMGDLLPALLPGIPMLPT
jgi:hypothetical protein